MDKFLIYTNTMANFHLGDNAHREYRKVRDAAIAEVAELREKLRVYEEEVPAQLKAQADAALRLSAEMSELQDLIDAVHAIAYDHDCDACKLISDLTDSELISDLTEKDHCDCKIYAASARVSLTLYCPLCGLPKSFC